MKVLVCGSRSWRDTDTITTALAQLPRGTEIISGGARGADSLAVVIARGLGLSAEVVPADWSQGRHAGLTRNIEMLDMAPDLVIAFWDGESTGTTHTIAEATKRGIPIDIYGGPSGKAVEIRPTQRLFG